MEENESMKNISICPVCEKKVRLLERLFYMIFDTNTDCFMHKKCSDAVKACKYKFDKRKKIYVRIFPWNVPYGEKT